MDENEEMEGGVWDQLTGGGWQRENVRKKTSLALSSWSRWDFFSVLPFRLVLSLFHGGRKKGDPRTQQAKYGVNKEAGKKNKHLRLGVWLELFGS